MQNIAINWQAWYGNEKLTLTFPDEWEIITASMRNADAISDNAIRAALLNPIGTLPLAQIAKGKKNIVIAIDDLSRPTETHRILPILLEELEMNGVQQENITIIVSLGSHRPLTRDDLIKKIGLRVYENYRVYNHCCFDDLVDWGETDQGTPITVNRTYLSSDLKIGISYLAPHMLAGFSGGAKIVLPGLCGIETLLQSHQTGIVGKRKKNDGSTRKDFRSNIEDATRKIGLDFSINVVGTAECTTAAVYAGDFVEAHAEAQKKAKAVYDTTIPEKIDIGIFNAYPKDTEFIQCSNALNIWTDPDRDLVKKDGTIIIITAASEGRGCHFLSDVGMKLYNKLDKYPLNAKRIANRELIIYCPNVSKHDVFDYFSEQTIHFKKWEQVIEYLCIKYKQGTRTVVYPCSSIQIVE